MKDYRYRYSVTLQLAHGTMTPAGWATRSRAGRPLPSYLAGTPTSAKLARYVADYNASLEPGGVNEHIGIRGTAVAALITDHDTQTVVARYLS